MFDFISIRARVLSIFFLVLLLLGVQLPFLRIGQGQPVLGTKILGDCFEAVLGELFNAGSISRNRLCNTVLFGLYIYADVLETSRRLHTSMS